MRVWAKVPLSQSDSVAMAGPCAFCDSISQSDLGMDQNLQAAVQALEQRLLAKMDLSIAQVQQNMDQKECNLRADIDQMVWNINMKSNELSRNIDTIGAESFGSRTDLMAQIDELRIELSKEAFEARADSLESFRELEEKMADLSKTIDTIGAESFESRTDLMTQIDDVRIELSKEAFEARVDSLESFKEQEEKISSLSQEAFEARADSCLASFEELKESMASLMQSTSVAMHDLEFQEAQLAGEIADEALRDWEEAQQDSPELLKDAVRNLSQRQAAEISPGAKAQQKSQAPEKRTALEIDMMEQQVTNAPQLGPQLSEYRQLSKLGATGIPFSSKLSMPVPPSVSTGSTTKRFAHFADCLAAPRPPARMTSSQSMPLLAPL